MYKNGLISAIWFHFDFDTSTKETRKEDETVKDATVIPDFYVFLLHK